MEAPAESTLLSCIQESIALHLFDNAKFLAERLVASYPSETNIYLQALCYKHCNQTYRAFHVLQGHTNPQSRYLYAVCALQLGRLQDAYNALQQFGDQQVPNGAAGHYLLGRICHLQRNPDAAMSHYMSALQLNPLLWSAYDELCAMGADQQAADVCAANTALVDAQVEAYTSTATEPATTSTTAAATPAAFAAAAADTPATAPQRQGLQPSALAFSPTPVPFNLSSMQPPAAPGRPQQEPSSAAGPSHMPSFSAFASPMFSTPSFVTPTPAGAPAGAPPAVAHKGAAAGAAAGGPPAFPGFSTGPASAASTPAGPAGSKTPTIGGGRHKVVDEGKMRKVSGRLFADPASSANPRRSARLAASGQPATTPGAPQQAGKAAPAGLRQPDKRPDTPGKPGSRAQQGSSSSSSAPSTAAPNDGFGNTWLLLAPLYEGHRHLCMYRCQEAVQAFGTLTQQQYNTAWVQCQLGRAAIEMIDYQRAAQCFEKARGLDKFRVEDMALYSTALWHLRKEVELAALSQELLAVDRLSAQAWLVAGNCYSLQQEHEQALAAFKRALQVDPTCVYAHTLCGHEYLAAEDLDSAAAAYNAALAHDPRHYNALYGLGQILLRQERPEQAVHKFAEASKISPGSSVLQCYLGIALARLGRHEQAIRVLQQAVQRDPRNPLARYELATAYMGLDMADEALEVLEALRGVAPREPSVCFQMGRLYKQVGRLEDAVRSFHLALDLKPSAADVAIIKGAIDKVHLPDEDLDEEV